MCVFYWRNYVLMYIENSFYYIQMNGGPKKGHLLVNISNYILKIVYFELVYFVTALVPSLTACLANSPGNNKRTAV